MIAFGKKPFLFIISLLAPMWLHADKIKFSILTPKGSTWTNLVEALSEELSTATNQQLSLKIYDSGKKGDEADVIRLMNIENVDAAAFTGIGLGIIFPQIRMLELPFMWDSRDELFYVLEKTNDFFKQGFQKQGFKLLAFAPPGFVNIFSKAPIKTIADLQKIKMWQWTGDPLVAAMFKAFSISGVEVSLPDVLTSLQTGMISAAYAPPLGALVMQWSSKVNYITTDPLALSMGAFLITQKKWDKIDPKHQESLLLLTDKYAKRINQATDVDNLNALDVFKREGKIFVQFESKDLETALATAKSVRHILIDQLYAREELETLMRHRHAYREQQNTSLTTDLAAVEKALIASKETEKASLETTKKDLLARHQHQAFLLAMSQSELESLKEKSNASHKGISSK